jgi:hypothetical protein
MKTLGIVFVIAGTFALIYGGIGYSREKTMLDVGSMKATYTEHHEVPLTPIAGGMALISGLVFLAMPRRQVA